MAIPLAAQAPAEATVPGCAATVAYAEVTVSGANDAVATFLRTQAYTDDAVPDADDAVATSLPTQSYPEARVPYAIDTVAILLPTQASAEVTGEEPLLWLKFVT